MSANYMPEFSPVVAALREAFPGKWIVAESPHARDARCYLAEGASITLESRRTRDGVTFYATAYVSGLPVDAFFGPTPEWAIAQAVAHIRTALEYRRCEYERGVAWTSSILDALPVGEGGAP